MGKLKILKQLLNYYSFYRFCLWGGPLIKAEWIYENRIEPLAREHPFLNFIAAII